jgi:subtilisin family serine protease
MKKLFFGALAFAVVRLVSASAFGHQQPSVPISKATLSNFWRQVLLVILGLALPLVQAAELGSADPKPSRGPDRDRQVLARFAGPDLRGKDGPMARLGLDLVQLHGEFRDHQSRTPGQAFHPRNRLLRTHQQRVLIDAIAVTDPLALRDALVSLGMGRPAVYGRYVSGLLPIAALPAVAELAELRLARPAYPYRHAGSVTSQGDIALRADLARATYSVDGAGVVVGSLSDSYNCQGGAAADVASGDLPAGILVLAEEPGCSSGTDETRALAQIIHDVAPGSAQVVHTAFGGTADFATGIGELFLAGATVITDDVIYFAEPMFQDGPIAQAVDFVASAAGVAYFSAAGNQARQSYESVFRPVPTGVVTRHDFDPGPGTDLFLNLTIGGGELAIFVLQWDQPYFSVSGSPGATSDVDIILLAGDGGSTGLAGGVDENIGGDPVEVFGYINPSPVVVNYRLVVELYAGAVPGRLKLIYFGNVALTEFATNSSTVYGHANAAGAAAIGASRYTATPAFGVDPPQLEFFSSAGGTPILFDTSGNSISVVRQKPEFVAPDGVDNTFFGSDYEPNGWPNFFGTSASAPHAAGVAALLKSLDSSLTPAGILTALQDTALDMGVPGVDFDSGYGLIQADQALASVAPPPMDTDGDGVEDDLDNCVAVPNGPLAPDFGGNSQLDTDGDNYGNICDPDFNNNGIVDSQDGSILKASFGSTSSPNQDLNGNGVVDSNDGSRLKSLFGQPPGPSGLAP